MSFLLVSGAFTFYSLERTKLIALVCNGQVMSAQDNGNIMSCLTSIDAHLVRLCKSLVASSRLASSYSGASSVTPSTTSLRCDGQFNDLQRALELPAVDSLHAMRCGQQDFSSRCPGINGFPKRACAFCDKIDKFGTTQNLRLKQNYRFPSKTRHSSKTKLTLKTIPLFRSAQARLY